MKKRGFTLIEMMAVIILLCIVVLIAFPTIINSIKRSGGKINETNKALIISAAEDKVNKQKNEYPMLNGNIFCIKINDLVTEGFLISDLKDGITQEKINLEHFVKIEVVDSKYNYDISETCNRNIVG